MATTLMDAAELPEIIERYRDVPFAWGELDCCLFAANVVRDWTGVDHAATYRGTYDTEFGAARLIQPHGDLEGFVSSNLGPMRAPTEARRGDFVLGPVPEPALGICVGRRAVFKALDGFAALPIDRCTGSWPCKQ